MEVDEGFRDAYDFLYDPFTRQPKPWRTVCRAHKLARRKPNQERQNSLLRWIRPPTWCATDAFAACLDDDARGIIVQRLLCLRDAASVKAFALVNHACARAVAQVLRATQLRLQRALAGVSRWSDATPTREAGQPLRDAMQAAGIPWDRASEILWAHRTTWIHRPATVLAHVSNSCELCGAPMGSRTCREGPVSLHACSACVEKHRVRFVVGLTFPEYACTLDKALDASQHCVKIKLYDGWGGRGSVAWVRARFMLSRKTQHRKRMLRQRGEISSTVQREQHEIELTEPMRRFLSAVPNGRFFRGTWKFQQPNEPEMLKLQVEAWLQLPRELPQDLTFSALMGITETEELAQSAQVVVDRRLAKAHERNVTLTTFRKLYKEARETRLNVASVVCGDYFGVTQLIDVCHAANALKLRALMNKHALGNINAMRDAVSLSPDERTKALWRLDAVVRLLRAVVAEHELDEMQDTNARALCLAIARRAGDALFHHRWCSEAEARLLKIVRICMTAPLKLRLDKRQHDVEDDQVSAHVVLTYYVPRADGAKDQRIRLRGRLLNWKSYARELGDVFYDMPAKLTPESLKRLTLWANYQPGRGQSRDCDENATNEEMCLKTRAMLAQAFVGATAWQEAVEKFHAC